MTNKCIELKSRFLRKFSYCVKVPFDVIMEEPKACERFCEIVERSIDTGIDETIEAYGTTPPRSFEPSKIFID